MVKLLDENKSTIKTEVEEEMVGDLFALIADFDEQAEYSYKKRDYFSSCKKLDELIEQAKSLKTFIEHNKIGHGRY